MSGVCHHRSVCVIASGAGEESGETGRASCLGEGRSDSMAYNGSRHCSTASRTAGVAARCGAVGENLCFFSPDNLCVSGRFPTRLHLDLSGGEPRPTAVLGSAACPAPCINWLAVNARRWGQARVRIRRFVGLLFWILTLERVK